MCTNKYSMALIINDEAGRLGGWESVIALQRELLAADVIREKHDSSQGIHIIIIA